MDDRFPLGKPIRPEPAPIADKYERFTSSHGDRLMRNKRTGAIETAPPQKIPEPEVIYTTEQWDAMCACLQRQEDDGFSLSHWGTF